VQRRQIGETDFANVNDTGAYYRTALSNLDADYRVVVLTRRGLGLFGWSPWALTTEQEVQRSADAGVYKFTAGGLVVEVAIQVFPGPL
jgi:hypothetical protein